uniref:Mucin peritrophin salivary protein n=1 Tax=Amblyomma variegatum TaxID=34610 RepID=F0J9X3_AMBVA|nr:TPA_inf: mucin peritrophin salivary protein [Amblyomma variegatum]
MVNSVVNRAVKRMGMKMVWVVAVVMVVVVVPSVVAKKAKKDPASYGQPPAASADCDGVAVGMGGATKVADPDDCTKYSLCLATFGFKLDCPEGKHFSVADGFCTSPEKAGCDPAFATAAPAVEDAPAPAAEDAAEEASGDDAEEAAADAPEAKEEATASPDSAEQAEQPANEPAGDGEQDAQDAQQPADNAADEA